MKLHLVTIGEPKLPYARLGWQEYLGRLKRYHTLRVTHISDKHAYDVAYIQQVIKGSYAIALTIGAREFSSTELATFLERHALLGKELTFIIGGPEGLPEAIQEAVDLQWGLSALTLPHDLAMVVVAEALYRASTISAGHPYHK